MTTYKHEEGTTLHTSQTCHPYNSDWQCVDGNYDGAPDAGPQVVGEGATEILSIMDYYEKRIEWLDDLANELKELEL